MKNDTLIEILVPDYITSEGKFIFGETCKVPYCRAVTLQQKGTAKIISEDSEPEDVESEEKEVEIPETPVLSQEKEEETDVVEVKDQAENNGGFFANVFKKVTGNKED